MKDVEQQPCMGHLDSSPLFKKLQSLPVWGDDVAASKVTSFFSPASGGAWKFVHILFVERAKGAKQLVRLVRAGVHGRVFAIDRPVVSAKV